ncbi:MAG TPA: alcohol dehydrogenase catalytic domain-containing protein [Arachnia sp.]|nr:alcohol dehydrogenase catalytic domain-containing protein [Arachnia sp.]
MQEVKGVVARAKGAPVTLETILVPDPGPGEAVVAVQACGVCHTDLHYRDGGINDEFPFLLGHEAAGVVEAVGDGVTNVKPGDFVVLNWRAVCGDCRACRRGEPQYCFSTFNAAQRMTLADGAELSPALGIGAFVEKTLVHSGQCTLVDPEARAAAVGIPQTWKQAFYARDLAGTVVLVGVPHPDAKVPDIPLIDVFGRGGALKSSWYGDCLPSRDFPMLVDLYRQGRLDLDAFVTEEVGLGDVEEAFEKMHGGDVLRSVVIL